MKKLSFVNDFVQNESGAVTVDWVVLTAAVIGLGVAVAASVGTGATDLADDVESNLTNTSIVSYLPPPTIGDLLGVGHTDPAPRFCTADGCSVSEQISRVIYYHEMSDGSTWRKTETTTITYLEDTVDSATVSDMVTTWKNNDNEIVDAPEVG